MYDLLTDYEYAIKTKTPFFLRHLGKKQKKIIIIQNSNLEVMNEYYRLLICHQTQYNNHLCKT